MAGRLGCWGGPFDGRDASHRLPGTRAYLDRAGRVHLTRGPGRALYQVGGGRWEFIGHLWQRCDCGAWVQSDPCQLCGGKPPG